MNKKSMFGLVMVMSSILILGACSDDKEKEPELTKEEKLQTELNKLNEQVEEELVDETKTIPNGVMLYESKDDLVLSEDDYLKVSYKGIRTFIDENGMKEYGFNEEQSRMYEILLYVENKKLEDVILKGGESLKINDTVYDEFSYSLEETINAKTKKEVSVLLHSYGGDVIKVDIENMNKIELIYQVNSFFDNTITHSSYEKIIDNIGEKNNENIKETLEKIKKAREDSLIIKQEQIELMIDSGMSEEDVESIKENKENKE